jgi:hypothetical protein
LKLEEQQFSIEKLYPDFEFRRFCKQKSHPGFIGKPATSRENVKQDYLLGLDGTSVKNQS